MSVFIAVLIIRLLLDNFDFVAPKYNFIFQIFKFKVAMQPHGRAHF